MCSLANSHKALLLADRDLDRLAEQLDSKLNNSPGSIFHTSSQRLHTRTARSLRVSEGASFIRTGSLDAQSTPLCTGSFLFIVRLAELFDPWCGDINERASKALAEGRTNPVSSNMAEIIPDGQFARYPCDTQEEDDPSFGHAPLSNLSGTTGDNAPGEPDDLVLGFGTIVPRWDTRPPGGTKLQYFVPVEGYPSADQARNAAATFQKAADSWNELKLGVSISQTTDRASANFNLVYKLNPTVGPGMNTLARAFFPHEVDQDVVVFQRGLEPNYKSILNNVFQHEIGHILGLRHEFAITGDDRKGLRAEANGAVQYMEMNYDSIMSYNMPPRMQDSDREQVAKFYQMPNGFIIGGSPITDYQPQIRRQNR